ncbi:MAG TPA: hypothetical protein VGP39_11205 [Bradyrhizobium sp.]|nr:hypothetical protein [Bradyrhizobium sp.]
MVVQKPVVPNVDILADPDLLVATPRRRQFGEARTQKIKNAAAMNEGVVDDESGQRLRESVRAGPAHGWLKVATVEEHVLRLAHHGIFRAGPAEQSLEVGIVDQGRSTDQRHEFAQVV